MIKRKVESLVYFCQCRDGMVDLPTGLDFRNASFQRRDFNLVIESLGSNRVFVRDFFHHKQLPALRTADNNRMSGNLAAAFATLSERTVSALRACGE